jgi:hypothetical protein
MSTCEVCGYIKSRCVCGTNPPEEEDYGDEALRLARKVGLLNDANAFTGVIDMEYKLVRLIAAARVESAHWPAPSASIAAPQGEAAAYMAYTDDGLEEFFATYEDHPTDAIPLYFDYRSGDPATAGNIDYQHALEAEVRRLGGACVPPPKSPSASIDAAQPAQREGWVLVEKEELRGLLEYWNGHQNERAMCDALEHILGWIERTLAAAPSPITGEKE